MAATYHLVVHGVSTEPIRVHSFHAREAMNECYAVAIKGSADVSDSATFTTFDPRRPMTQLSYSASSDGRLGGVGGLLQSVQGALPGEVAGVLGTATQLVGAGLEIANAAGADTGEAGEILGAIDGGANQLGMAIGHRQRLAITESHYPFLFPSPKFAAQEPRRMLDAEP